MSRMSEHMMPGMQYLSLLAWSLVALLGLLAILAVLFFVSRVPPGRFSVREFASGLMAPFRDSLAEASRRGSGLAVARDTLFILPDISHYTRFMSGSHFSAAHAQHIVLSLIKAMIDTATRTVEISKLEGDAALFYADADRHSASAIGESVMNIFAAFFRERKRLGESNLCPCRACRHIGDLDLKVFVHRGKAARFQFRGSVDLFGTDVIVLHRLMKNSVNSHRYVMVTDAAAGNIRLPGRFNTSRVEEDVRDVGGVRASVYEIDEARAVELAESGTPRPLSPVVETGRKLLRNLGSLRHALGRRRSSA